MSRAYKYWIYHQDADFCAAALVLHPTRALGGVLHHQREGWSSCPSDWAPFSAWPWSLWPGDCHRCNTEILTAGDSVVGYLTLPGIITFCPSSGNLIELIPTLPDLHPTIKVVQTHMGTNDVTARNSSKLQADLEHLCCSVESLGRCLNFLVNSSVSSTGWKTSVWQQYMTSSQSLIAFGLFKPVRRRWCAP